MSMLRKAAAAVAALAIVAVVAVSWTGTTAAANLTGGTYTYVIHGEEVSFTFDPVSRKDGLLLPLEVFQHLGITVNGALEKSFTMTKGGVTATLTVGATAIDVGGRADTVVTAPLRLNGRLFVPADLLKQFGVEFTQDGTFVVMRYYVDPIPSVTAHTTAQYAQLRAPRTVSANVKADSGVYLAADFTPLNSDLVASSALNVAPGMRIRLHGLLQTNTLVLVKLSNDSFKAGALAAANLTLVDDSRVQYDLASVLDIGQGLVSAKLSPSADRMGVLIYPRLATDVETLTLYYDNNGTNLGSIEMQ